MLFIIFCSSSLSRCLWFDSCRYLHTHSVTFLHTQTPKPPSPLWDGPSAAVKCFEFECSVDLSSISMPACQFPCRVPCCPAKSCYSVIPPPHTHTHTLTVRRGVACSKHSNLLLLQKPTLKSHHYLAIFIAVEKSGGLFKAKDGLLSMLP